LGWLENQFCIFLINTNKATTSKDSNMLESILANLANFFTDKYNSQRKVRFTIHRAFFQTNRVECLFLTVTNLSVDRDIELTHIYLEGSTQVNVKQTDRPLPVRLKPDEIWETFIKVQNVPPDILVSPYNKGRARLSTGKVYVSKKNKSIPNQGTIPGPPIKKID
jgi:hypothetical protein